MWCTRVCKRLAEAISWRLLLETTKVRDQGRKTLLFLYHQLPILNPQIGDEARQLQAVFLFVHLFLQLVIHQRNWNIEIANLEFRRIEGNVSALRAQMTANCDVQF